MEYLLRRIIVWVRVLAALLVFGYVIYKGSAVLPRFDIVVVTSFFALYLLWNAVAALVYKEPEERPIEIDDRRSYTYMQLPYLIGLFFGAIDFVGLHSTRINSLEPGIIYAGFILYILSCVLRWWGLRAISENYHLYVAVYANHKLVTEGPYRRIRHPLYLGTMLGWIAIAMVFNSWGAMLIFLAAGVPAMFYRIRLEEEFMLKHFGDEYREYMQRTKKIIPGIW